MQAARLVTMNFTAVHLQFGQHFQTGQFLFPLKGKHVDGKEIQRRVMQHEPFAKI